MTAEVLKGFYKTEPASKSAIEKAAGYAVFANTGVNVLLLSTARGSGLALNNKTKQETFMKMVSVGGGPYALVAVIELARGKGTEIENPIIKHYRWRAIHQASRILD